MKRPKFLENVEVPDMSGLKAKFKPRVIIILILIVVIGICAASSVKIIPTGYTGVKISFGQVSEKSLQPGLHFVIPFMQHVESVNTKQQDIEFSDEFWGESAERTTVYAEDVVVTYRIASDKAAYIYANISTEMSALISYDLVASAIKSAMKELGVEEVTNRGKIESLTCEKLSEAVDEKYGPNVVSVIKITINQMDFEDSYNEALAEKQIAQQIYERQQIENQTKIEKAQADAEALLIKSKAEAEANEILNNSLSYNVLEYLKIDKWDGVLPTVTGTDAIVNID